jgi:hypothetical protein
MSLRDILKQKTCDEKQDENKVNIGCASLVQYMKNKLQADAEHDWNTLLEWISDQAKVETFELNNDIDGNNTSKENNDVSDINKGRTQNMSEEEGRGKGFNNSSSSDDNEDDNQNDDDRGDTNKKKAKGSIWEVESDEENEWNKQGSTDGDINKMANQKMTMMPVTMMKWKVTPTRKRVGGQAILGMMMI